PEIEHYLQECTPFDSSSQGAVVFTPHLLPLSRGILTSSVLRFKRPQDPAQVRAQFADFAKREPFVTLLADGHTAEIKMAQYTNDCVVSLHHDPKSETWLVMTALDNLVKGASGQAVQNLNLMYGFNETTALV
ncbi:MAG TPA: Asd/ArgC dimerization domain-containing protein, partial [bacterium]